MSHKMEFGNRNIEAGLHVFSLSEQAGIKEGPAPLSASLVQRENTGLGYVYPESAEHAAPDCTGKDGDSVVTHFVWASWSLRHVRKTCADIHSVNEEHFAGPLRCGCPRQCVAKVLQP